MVCTCTWNLNSEDELDDIIYGRFALRARGRALESFSVVIDGLSLLSDLMHLSYLMGLLRTFNGVKQSDKCNFVKIYCIMISIS